jgi:tetratricopeptide (TPR) repeat protein
MGLAAVYLGHQSWEDYISGRDSLVSFEKALEQRAARFEESLVLPGAMQIGLSAADYQVALESGLGALGPGISTAPNNSDYSIEFAFEQLAGGLDQLNADFNFLLGDVIWKLEMHEETLSNLLHEIRLAEFEREARAYRSRAEKAYFNGWYEEALADFLEAEKRNYPDFGVLRSIANICLYHLINLTSSLDYFRKAAKYSRPSDARQSAEAHYFAGVVCAIQQQFREGLDHFGEAIALNPALFEAHYQRACLAAMLGEADDAVASLELAIKGDPRYYERAKADEVFDGVRPEVSALLDRLMQPVQAKLAEVGRDASRLKGYVIATPEKRQTLSTMFQSVEQRLAAANTYRSGVQFMGTLSQVQQELRGLYDLFYKQYDIGTRDYVRSVAISPDGRMVASGFLYEGIKIWEVDSGLPLRAMRSHTASVNSISFSPDSQWLVSGSRDRTIKLWDVSTGQVIRTMEEHDGEVRAVAFSPDGVWLASGSTDSTVRLWRVITGREVQPFIGHERPVTSVVFSPDGRFIASGSLDRTIKLWEAATGKEVKSFEGHTEGVASIAYSPDGRFIASGGEDKMVRIWDVATAREFRTLTGHINDVTSVAFSPNGELVAGGSLGQTIRIWKLSNGRLLKTLWFSEIGWHPVAFSPKGQWMALASRDVQLWLKALLTEEEYAEVKAGEERGMLGRQEAEAIAFELAELKRVEKDEAAQEIVRAQRRAAGECEMCGIRLNLARRLTRRERCKAHKLSRGYLEGASYRNQLL